MKKKKNVWWTGVGSNIFQKLFVCFSVGHTVPNITLTWYKKNIKKLPFTETWIPLPPASAHTSLDSSPCSKPICWAKGSPKEDFVFTPNTTFHIVSYLSGHLDKASHLKSVKFVPLFSCIVLLQFFLKPYKICIRAYLTTRVFQKGCRKEIT